LWTSGRAIWIAVSVATATVVAVGLGSYFFTVGKSIGNARNGSVAAFVGSETCAGCHEAEAKLWLAS
jgi:hypothetical protein